MIHTVSEQMGVRFTPEDRQLLAALRQKLGLSSISQIIKLALRALAEKENVTV
jgi:hypothetical protein